MSTRQQTHLIQVQIRIQNHIQHQSRTARSGIQMRRYYQKFSKVSSILKVLYKATVGLIYAKFLHCMLSRMVLEIYWIVLERYWKFLKVISILNLPYKMTVELIFAKCQRYWHMRQRRLVSLHLRRVWSGTRSLGLLLVTGILFDTLYAKTK